MREHRRGLARFASGRAVLNLFSYTGALGLACARAGASVTNVDTSAGVQAWARGNFERNGATARFETGDAVRYLQRAARDKERYDLVDLRSADQLDCARGERVDHRARLPRSDREGRGRRKPARRIAVARRETFRTKLASLAKLAHKGLRGRGAAVLEVGGLPPEYPTVLAQPADRYLQVCLVRLA